MEKNPNRRQWLANLACTWLGLLLGFRAAQTGAAQPAQPEGAKAPPPGCPADCPPGRTITLVYDGGRLLTCASSEGALTTPTSDGRGSSFRHGPGV